MAMPPRVRSRREMRAQTVVPRRTLRDSPHRDPSPFEVIVGVTVFLVFAAGCLYLAALLGR